MAGISLRKLAGRKGREYNAPWEAAFDRILTPFEEFIHRQSTSGVLLLSCAVVALFIANGPFADAYAHWLHTPTAIAIGGATLKLSLHHWINDGLMAWFFLHVGLELKREALVGELADLRQAALPAIAALGGMVVPALIYFAFNPTGHTVDGWGIPMATDIAFAVGVCALLGDRVPKSLLMFLVALAIVDDLGAIIIIAVFYTGDINVAGLLWAAVALAALVIMNLGGVRRALPYLLVGAGMWLALLYSGVHATLAGVITAFSIPARPKYDPVAFSAQAKNLLRRFDGSYRPGQDLLRNESLRTYVQALSAGCRQVLAPLQRIEHVLHLPVTYIVIPVFALANAGIPFDVFSQVSLANPVTLGVMAGLVGGKLIGIAGSTWLAWKAGVGNLPPGCTMRHIVAVGFLGGIGFTMSIFIAELGFARQPGELVLAKAGVLGGSVLSGIAGALVLYFGSGRVGTDGRESPSAT